MIIGLIITYLLSVVGSWYATRCFLIKTNSKAEIGDVALLFLPVINISVFAYYFEYLPFKVSTNWFFLIKEAKK